MASELAERVMAREEIEKCTRNGWGLGIPNVKYFIQEMTGASVYTYLSDFRRTLQASLH